MCSSMLKLFCLSAFVLGLGLVAAAQADAVQSVLSAVNTARAKAGCAPLRTDPALMAAAKGHAKAMAEQNFFGHAGKDGSRFSSRIRVQGYSFGAAAENIAAGQKTAGQVMQSWLKSAGHRRNILNCRMTETGIAVVYQPGDMPLRGSRYPLRYYWVQVFAAPA